MRIGVGVAPALLGALMTAAQPRGAAAGKYCGDVVESGVSSGTTQEEALVAAQLWWSSRARALGRGFESWDNADDQALECSKDVNGDYRCKASARPCLPEGVPPETAPKLDM